MTRPASSLVAAPFPSAARGFGDPVFDAQAVFRATLDALARPGTVHELGGDARPPAPLGAGIAAVALALCDSDTRLWLGPSLRGEAARFLAFETGAPLADDPAADFAIAAAAEAPEAASLAPGTLENPHLSTTLVVEVEGLDPAPDRADAWRLSGPGIDGEARLHVRGAPWGDGFAGLWAANRALFPRGFDLLLVADTRVAALPRTTRVSVEGAR